MTSIIDLIKFQESINIADDLDKDLLRKIGSKVIRDYKMDKDSRAEWEKITKEAMDIAKQVIKTKTYPWDKAANIKYPLMTFGAIQFAARTYPELVKDGRVVESFAAGEDPDGSRAARAKRISAYMSYQLLIDSNEWEKDTDKLLHMLPIVGTVFRKTYYDSISKHPCSELCNPDEIVIHNSVKSVESARRVTHILHLYTNDVVERINAGVYRDIDLKLLNSDNVQSYGQIDKNDDLDDDKSHQFLEMHTFYDLDDDGYAEPCIITVHFKSEEVVRIVSRFDAEDITVDPKGKFIGIKPTCYFTDYHFIPDPEGGFYSLGFGTLLYPINEAINSVFNQLLDAGTLSNMQSGFIGSDLRIQGGEILLQPGTWKKIESMGSALKDNILPLPVKEPSQTLLQLLQLLLQTGKDLTGVIDILPDDQQTQNVPATTILALLDQRLKPLKSIFKRIYRSFKKEFEKLYRLNSIYLPDQNTYFTILNTPLAITQQDFKEPDYDVRPIADPSMSSESQRLMKAQMIKAALGEPGGNVLNISEVMERWLSELQMPNTTRLIQAPPPPKPSADELNHVAAMAKIQSDSQNHMITSKLKMASMSMKHKEMMQVKAPVEAAKIEKMKAEAILDVTSAQVDAKKADMDAASNAIDQKLKFVDLASKVKLKNKELDIQQEANQNANVQPDSGVESPPSNSQL